MAKPNLRFKEFTADWHNIKLGSFITERNQICDDSDIPLYSLTIEQGITPKTERYTRDFLVKDDSNAYKTVFPNDFAMNPMNLRLGAISYNQENKQVKLSKYYNVFYVDTSKVDRSFFCSFATCEKAIALYNLMATGSLVEKRRNHFKDFVEYEMPFPNINEQTKIASFLSTVDTKIAQLSQKLHLLDQYKQGMMQKLFSQQIRFKADDGSEFWEWVEYKLGEISTTFSGGTPKSTNKDFFIGTIPFVKSGEISKKHTDQFINELALKESSAKLVKKGDLLYALYGATSGQVALSQIDGAINQAVLCIRSKHNTKYLLNFFLWKKDSILSTYLQGGQGNLSAAILKEILIPIPCLEEQTKIANFLSAIDQKIDVASEQLEQAKLWKKGLLQQMFV